jgi:hypothetical protein
MSSFICSELHFNSVEYYIAQRQLGNDPIYCLRKLAKTANKWTTSEEIAGFVDALREINVLCTTLKYKHHYEGKLDTEIEGQKKTLFNNKATRLQLNEFGLYKALQCINYQIEIFHLTEIRALTATEELAMQLLGEISNEIAAKIIRKLPEYTAAAWSI